MFKLKIAFIGNIILINIYVKIFAGNVIFINCFINIENR